MMVAIDVDRPQPGARVRFPGSAYVVTLIAVSRGQFWEFFYDGPLGPGKQVLAELELAGIDLPDRHRVRV